MIKVFKLSRSQTLAPGGCVVGVREEISGVSPALSRRICHIKKKIFLHFLSLRLHQNNIK